MAADVALQQFEHNTHLVTRQTCDLAKALDAAAAAIAEAGVKERAEVGAAQRRAEVQPNRFVTGSVGGRGGGPSTFVIVVGLGDGDRDGGADILL